MRRLWNAIRRYFDLNDPYPFTPPPRERVWRTLVERRQLQQNAARDLFTGHLTHAEYSARIKAINTNDARLWPHGGETEG